MFEPCLQDGYLLLDNLAIGLPGNGIKVLLSDFVLNFRDDFCTIQHCSAVHGLRKIGQLLQIGLPETGL